MLTAAVNSYEVVGPSVTLVVLTILLFVLIGVIVMLIRRWSARQG